MQNAKYSVIEPDQLIRAIEAENHWLLADVRPKQDYITQHIPGSINVSQSQLLKLIETIDPEKNIVLVCDNGKLARRSALRLERDYNNLFVLEGGVMLWRASGFPTDHRILTVPEELQLDVIFSIGAVFSAAMILSVAPILVGIGATAYAGRFVARAANKASLNLAKLTRKNRTPVHSK